MMAECKKWQRKQRNKQGVADKRSKEVKFRGSTFIDADVPTKDMPMVQTPVTSMYKQSSEKQTVSEGSDDLLASNPKREDLLLDTSISKEQRKLYELAIQFGLVFLYNKFAPIKCSRVCQEYQARFHKNLTLRNYQCTNMEQLVSKLPVFEWDGALGPNRKVSLSKSLLIEFLFTQILLLSPSKVVKEEDLAYCFKQVTGVDVEVMYDILQVDIEERKQNNFLRAIVKHCSKFVIKQIPPGVSYLTFRTIIHTPSTSSLDNSPIEETQSQENSSDSPPTHDELHPQHDIKLSLPVSTSNTQPLANKVLLPSPLNPGPGYTKQPLQALPSNPPVGMNPIFPPMTVSSYPRQTSSPDPRQAMGPDPRWAIGPSYPRGTIGPIPRQALGPGLRQAMSLDPRHAMVPGPRQAMGVDPRQTIGPGHRHAMVPGPRQAMGVDPRQTMGPGHRQTMGPDPRQTMGPGHRQTMGPDPRQTMGPGHRQAMGPDPRQTMGPGHRQTMGPDPRQIMSPGHRQSMGHDPMGPHPRQVMGSDPRLAVGPDSRQNIGPIPRQLIGSSVGPLPDVGDKSPDALSRIDISLSSQHSLAPQSYLHTSEQLPEKFPNPSAKLEDETFLPSHMMFRPDLIPPNVPAGTLTLPGLTKKSGAKDSKEKHIAKVNSKVEEIVEELSSKSKYLPLEVINDVTKDLVAKANRDMPYNDRIHWRSIKAQEHYSKIHGRVEELIKVFCWFNPVTSLYELERALVVTENVESYEALHLGPLLKHPRVKDLFKPPDDLEIIPEMTAFKIQKHLMAFLTKTKRGSKHSLEDFLEFLRTKEFQESINHLCIRISSFPLALQVSPCGLNWNIQYNYGAKRL